MSGTLHATTTTTKNSAQNTTHNKPITEQTVREVLNIKTNHRTINARDTRRKEQITEQCALDTTLKNRL